MTLARRLAARWLAAWCCLLPFASAARAGGGPENVFLVVNSASWASKTVANHFIKLRQIPAVNVFYLEWTGGFEGTDGDTLRERILGPTFEMIERRGMMGQIDYVVYSSDFPYVVDLEKDFAASQIAPQVRPVASLNSATFYWNLVFAKSPNLLMLQSNQYMRGAPKREPPDPTHSFRSWYGWNRNGDLLEAGGQPYMLSTMLAMTSGRGNSVREAIDYLTASAAADGTYPKGTIYFSKTADVRSRTRSGGFDAAIEQLKKLGVAAQIITTPFPSSKQDIAGAMSGAAEVSITARDKILPGAICENFTSFGGILVEGYGQTPLSEFLRHGAAGASGTVIEPYAIAEKFPSPELQVHYARGCSLAESYYQSVFAPLQLLIVGDPLARPWANIPEVRVKGLQANSEISGKITIEPQARTPRPGKIDHFELFVDGRRGGTTRPGGSLVWDTTVDSDGYHEFRIVAIEDSPIASQGRLIIPATVNNHKYACQLTTTPPKTVRWDEMMKIRLRSPGMTELFVHADGQEVRRVQGEEGEVEINPRQLGLGPVRLFGLAAARNDPRKRATSAPVELIVEPNRPFPALADAPQNLVHGLVLKLPDGKVVPVQSTHEADWLTKAGVGPEQPFTMQGFFDVATQDVYQFQLWHTGELKLTVDGHPLYQDAEGNNTQKWVAIALAVGKHRLTLQGRTGKEVKLRALYGGPGAVSLNGATFRHQRANSAPAKAKGK